MKLKKNEFLESDQIQNLIPIPVDGIAQHKTEIVSEVDNDLQGIIFVIGLLSSYGLADIQGAVIFILTLLYMKVELFKKMLSRLIYFCIGCAGLCIKLPCNVLRWIYRKIFG